MANQKLKRKRKPKNSYEKYATDVLAGKIPAGELIIQACQRFVDDLKNGHKRGLYFSESAAEHALSFFGYLKHSKGQWRGDTFELSPWQSFIVANLFGWIRADGLRRYRVGYIEVPRKNGKTTLLAGIGLYLFFADGEGGAEIYCAATKRDQAKIMHDEAMRMVKASPELNSRIGILRNNMHVLSTSSKFEPLGADSDGMDGLNPHGALIDELHAHKTRRVWDVLETATGARQQPMIIASTTAGFDRKTICGEQREYSEKILRGVINDDSYFAFIATIDEGDDWRRPATWKKANPNFGISVKPDDLKRKVKKAKEAPAAQNAFRRLHLNEWTEQDTRWLSIDAWDRCDQKISDSKIGDAECYCGLDLASVSDIAAFVALFPVDGGHAVKSMFWVPEDSIKKRSEKDNVPYDQWVRENHIKTTPGNIIDYDQIFLDICGFNNHNNVREIAFDRWNATQLTTQLAGEDITMVQFGQGFGSMSAPTKELEKLILSKKIFHAGNPVLRWMMSNVTVQTDPAGNIKPNKAKSTEKIDGIVAMVMALGRAIVSPIETDSVYSERGILVF